MKKLLLLLFPLIFSSCVGEIDKVPNGGESESSDTGTFYLTVANICDESDLSFEITTVLYSKQLKPKTKVKISCPILTNEIYTIEYTNAYNKTSYYFIKEPKNGVHYILTFNAMREPCFTEDSGTYSLRISNNTKYKYLSTDPYNNSTYSIEPATSQTLRNLPCNIDIPIKFETDYKDLDIKKVQYYEFIKKVRADYTFDYSITKVPTCEDYNLCYIYLTNRSSDNFCVLDSKGSEILTVAPGKVSFTAHSAGENALIIKQKDGYIFYPDEYSFNGTIPKCGSINFSVTDDDCIQSISY